MVADFIVLDTEGRDTVTEIALLDAQGVLLFAGFLEGGEVQHDTYPLAALLEQVSSFVQRRKIVCHYAEHDEKILKKSFAAAQFTLQLYRKIQQQRPQSITAHNPFTNTRVDSPFQQHIDLDAIHHHAFCRISTVLAEVKNDANQQSQGVVILGEAGHGKTHLMMRLAKHTLENNRLFFIRQPNHEGAVFYHIYSRMLESFIETIPDTDYSQLEYLLGRSFLEIVINTLKKKTKINKKGLEILEGLSQGKLNIYKILGKKGSEIKRRNWDYVERQTLQWWQETYGVSDYAADIITGLIKYCRYSDKQKRELVRRWLAGQRLSEEQQFSS